MHGTIDPRASQRRFRLRLSALLCLLLAWPRLTASSPLAEQREKERELVFRGLQYAEAIRVFENRFARLPVRLEELLTSRPRCIRQLWKDPLSGDGEWALILAEPERPEGGIRGVRSTSVAAPTAAPPGKGRYADWEFVGHSGSEAEPALQSLARLANDQKAKAPASREDKLRAALRELRGAIDEYKRASDRGLIPVDLGTDGYPKSLRILVDGVERTDAKGEKLTFLRRIPTDPTTGNAEWGLRSYQDRPSATSWGGEDVFDVYSLSSAVGSDGRRYGEW